MDEDIELEEESVDLYEDYAEDTFDAWRDNHPDEWERILGRKDGQESELKK